MVFLGVSGVVVTAMTVTAMTEPPTTHCTGPTCTRLGSKPVVPPRLPPSEPSPSSRKPMFSWHTVPVFAETSNVSGLFDNAALDTLARFPLFVAEKVSGYEMKDMFSFVASLGYWAAWVQGHT